MSKINKTIWLSTSMGLACYGQPYIHTPHIDQMAREGMRFTQCIRKSIKYF